MFTGNYIFKYNFQLLLNTTSTTRLKYDKSSNNFKKVSMDNLTVNKYNDNYKDQILTIWETSVLVTHDFWPQMTLKELVNNINFIDFEVFILKKEDLVLVFIGVADKKIEMPFLDPNYLGLGLGFQLLNFAVKELQADKVDLNEQNPRAVKFYKNLDLKHLKKLKRMTKEGTIHF